MKYLILTILSLLPLLLSAQNTQEECKQKAQACRDLFNEGKHQEACDCNQTALECTETLLGDSSLEYGVQLRLRGACFEFLDNDLEKALSQYELAYQIIDKHKLEYQEDFAKISLDIHRIYQNINQVQKAIPYLEKLYDITPENDILGRFMLDYHLGTCFYEKGEIEKFLQLRKKGIKLLKEQNDTINDQYITLNNELGYHCENISDFKKAKYYYTIVKNTLETAGVNNNEAYATVLFNLGTQFINLGDFKGSILYLENSLVLVENILPDSNFIKLDLYHSLGMSYGRIQDYKKSIPNFEKMYDLLSNEYYKGDSPYKINYYLNYIGILVEFGNYSFAKKLIDKTNSLIDKFNLKSTIAEAQVLSNSGLLNYKTGAYLKAEIDYLSQIKILESLERFEIYRINALINLATLYSTSTMYKLTEASEIYQDLILQFEKVKYPFNLLNDLHINYASLLIKKNDFREAEILLNKVLNNKNVTDVQLHHTHYRLSQIYFGQNNKNNALHHIEIAEELALNIFGSTSLENSDLLNHKGLIYSELENAVKAIECFKKSNEIRNELLPEDKLNLLVRKLNLSNLEKGHKSLEILSEIEKTIEVEFPKGLPMLSTVYLNKGVAYEEINDINKAIESYFKSLKLAKENNLNESHFLKIYHNLHTLYLDQKDYELCNNYLNKELEIVSKEIENSTYLDFFAKTQINGKFNSSKLFLQNRLIRSNAIPNYFNSTTFNYNNILNNWILNTEKAKRSLFQANNDNELYTQLKETQGYLNFFSTSNLENAREKLDSLEQKASLLEKQLFNSLSEEDKQYLTPVDVEKVQTALPNEQNYVIDFFNFPIYNYDTQEYTDSTRYCAFVLGKNDEHPTWVNLTNGKAIETLLAQQQTAIANGQETQAIQQALYQLIWQPLEPYLENKTHIHYAPSGLLNRVSFSALQNPNGTYLGEQFQLFTYGSLRDMLIQQNKTTGNQASKNVVLCANPTYSIDSTELTPYNSKETAFRGEVRVGNANVAEWNELQGTEREMKKLNTIFSNQGYNVTTLSETNAREEAIKALDGNAPQILHIATHGFFLPHQAPTDFDRGIQLIGQQKIQRAENPLLRSGLVMAGANHVWQGNAPIENVDDGLLTAYEIVGLDFPETELVVLSACETGLGDIHSTEGVMGLQRAFLLTGADAVLMSLWAVSDKATPVFMEQFYTNWLSKGMSKRQALQEAQSYMKNHPLYSDPQYWGAWVLIGE